MDPRQSTERPLQGDDAEFTKSPPLDFTVAVAFPAMLSVRSMKLALPPFGSSCQFVTARVIRGTRAALRGWLALRDCSVVEGLNVEDLIIVADDMVIELRILGRLLYQVSLDRGKRAPRPISKFKPPPLQTALLALGKRVAPSPSCRQG
jgi:hypothetical protein